MRGEAFTFEASKERGPKDDGRAQQGERSLEDERSGAAGGEMSTSSRYSAPKQGQHARH